MGYLVFSNSCGQVEAADITAARVAAERMNAPDWDQPRIFSRLKGCAGTDCTCEGQIHPRLAEGG
jgi:hypothetical protein